MTKGKKSKIGVVIRHSAAKTAVVMVERRVKHPQFKKYVTRRKKFHVHDEKNEAREGDKVRIVECTPVSRMKRWKLHSVLEKVE